MVWDYIPKDEALILNSVWAMHDTREDTRKIVPAQPTPPTVQERPPPKKREKVPYDLIRQIESFIGLFEISKTGKHTWEILDSKTVKGTTRGHLAQKENETWQIWIRVKVRSRRFNLRLSWKNFKLTGQVFSQSGCHPTGLLPLTKARKQCWSCQKPTVVDGAYDRCIPCARTQPRHP